MSGLLNIFIFGWFAGLFLGLISLGDHQPIALFWFTVSFVFGWLFLKRLAIERETRKQAMGLRSTSSASPRISPSLAPLAPAAESKPKRSKEKLSELEVYAGVISTVCLGLGDTPAVNSFIQAKKLTMKEAAVFKFSLWLFHLSAATWIVQENDLDGSTMDFQKAIHDSFFENIKAIPENEVRFSDFVKAKEEVLATMDILRPYGISSLETRTNFWTLADTIYPYRFKYFSQDLTVGMTEWMKLGFPQIGSEPTMQACRRMLYYFSGEPAELYWPTQNTEAIMLNTLVFLPNFFALKEALSRNNLPIY